MIVYLLLTRPSKQLRAGSGPLGGGPAVTAEVEIALVADAGSTDRLDEIDQDRKERRQRMSNASPFELELLLDVGPVAGQWEVLMDPRPIATVGRCSHCDGATWQHQARDICGRCGHGTQHRDTEVRLLRRSA